MQTKVSWKSFLVKFPSAHLFICFPTLKSMALIIQMQTKVSLRSLNMQNFSFPFLLLKLSILISFINFLCFVPRSLFDSFSSYFSSVYWFPWPHWQLLSAFHWKKLGCKSVYLTLSPGTAWGLSPGAGWALSPGVGSALSPGVGWARTIVSVFL